MTKATTGGARSPVTLTRITATTIAATLFLLLLAMGMIRQGMQVITVIELAYKSTRARGINV